MRQTNYDQQIQEQKKMSGALHKRNTDSFVSRDFMKEFTNLAPKAQ